MERNIRFVIAYEGTEYHGWQTQGGLRTIQGLLEQGARRVLRHQVYVVGSGRTDAGVHAAGQVAHVRTTSGIPPWNMLRAIGSRIPKDISLIDVSEVSRAYHARRSATSKLYRYRMHAAPGRPVMRAAQRYVYHYWSPLDLDRMREGARYFVGEMDFSAMAAKGCERETMVRTVLRCDVHRRLDEIRVDVEGKGFLYNQVRNMVGTLIEVGRGRWEPEHIQTILKSRDRGQAGPTAPARGLCLQWVRYPAELLDPNYIPGDWQPVEAEAEAAEANAQAAEGAEQETAERELPSGDAGTP